MGKSISLKQDHKRLAGTWAAKGETHALIDLSTINSREGLHWILAQNPSVSAWRSGSGTLHLSLDSLDEALPGYPQLPKALVEELNGLDRARLRLVIACRAGDWPPYLEDQLLALFGASDVSIWHIAPLRQKDITIAANARLSDANLFLSEVSSRGLEPLAARPITLHFLISRYCSVASLPDDISVLYQEGCRHLVRERVDSSRFARSPDLDASQKLAIAGRIACVMLFGARTAIDGDPAGANDRNSRLVGLHELVGGIEKSNGSPFPIGPTEVNDVLRTALFTASGLQFRWSHKSYAEFLAAFHLKANAMSPGQMVSLVRCGNRVAPALRGIAAWLAVLSPPVFDELLRLDPEVLISGDLSGANPQQKTSLVEWLLDEAESESPLLNEWGFAWNYRKLEHPQLSEQLKPTIELHTSESRRRCAIEIARA